MSPGQSAESSFRIPVVRHFIACERIEHSPGSRNVGLYNLIHAIRPASDAIYPLIRRNLCLYVLLTDGSGRLPFQVRLMFIEEEETEIYTTPPLSRDLGSNPLAVMGWPLVLRNVPFPQPGLYEFRLLCAGQEIAREPIVLRDTL
jgi:hypothetical protein